MVLILAFFGGRVKAGEQEGYVKKKKRNLTMVVEYKGPLITVTATKFQHGSNMDRRAGVSGYPESDKTTQPSVARAETIAL